MHAWEMSNEIVCVTNETGAAGIRYCWNMIWFMLAGCGLIMRFDMQNCKRNWNFEDGAGLFHMWGMHWLFKLVLMKYVFCLCGCVCGSCVEGGGYL